MRARVDDAEVRQLAEDLAKAAAAAPNEVRQVVAKGALNIKKDAARRIRGLAHAPAYPTSITYDIMATRDVISAEIGPDKNRRQGPLGNILEFGTVNSPPHPHMRPATVAEQPRFEKALEDLARRQLEGR